MDIEWALDGGDGKLYIVQARPETVKSRASATCCALPAQRNPATVIVDRPRYRRAHRSRPGCASSCASSQMNEVQPGDVLVTDMTDPDWEPIMKRAAAIVTNRGGRTCHAAIIAREMGIPAVVGCGDATATRQ
jgi:pyruvate, water dikinase